MAEEVTSSYLVTSKTLDCTSKFVWFCNEMLFVTDCSLGTITFKNGDKYRGSFKDGHPCGQGTMHYKNSLIGSNGVVEDATYEGLWKGGRRDGQGTINWVDGTSFSGTWRYDQRHEGEVRFANGNIYQGKFLNDKLHGFARLFIATGVIFEGNFDQNHCDGVGKLLYPNGDIYFGQHKAFTKDGMGKMLYANGS